MGIRPVDRWSVATIVALGTLGAACAEPSTSSGGGQPVGGGGSGGTATTSTPSTSNGGGGATGGTPGGTGGTGGEGGCAEPLISADHPAEVEPNDTVGAANELAAGTKGFAGTLCPAGDVDVFAMTLSGGESIRVDVTDGNGGCPTTALPFVRVLDPAGNILASDTGFGCLTIAPATNPPLVDLPSGTYHVQIESAEPKKSSPYAIDIAVRPPECGDGIVQVAESEQCDDGGVASGDGCTVACQLEGDFVNEAEPNDTQANSTPLGDAQGVVGSLGFDGDVDYYSLQVTTAGSAISAIVSDGFGGCPYGFDSAILLYDPLGAQIAYADDGAVEECSFLDPVFQPGATNLPTGTYAIAVYSSLVLAQASYVLSATVHLPGCGDAIQVPGEQCDDGNTSNGDGCSATCDVEPPWEIEPNGSQGEATPLWPGTDRWRGRLLPVSDTDWLSFTVPNGADVTLSTNQLGNAGACDFDTVIHLVNAQGVELASNNDSGVFACSKLAPATDPAVSNMAAGKYYVWVQDVSESPLTPSYELRIDIQ